MNNALFRLEGDDRCTKSYARIRIKDRVSDEVPSKRGAKNVNHQLWTIMTHQPKTIHLELPQSFKNLGIFQIYMFTYKLILHNAQQKEGGLCTFMNNLL